MLTLLTKPPYSIIDTLKDKIRPQRGPGAVVYSLTKGLYELSVEYNLNPRKINSDTVAVLQNPKALRYAIEQKKQGQIKHLLAGPNIAVTPNDFGNLSTNPLIDKILVPSQWVKDFWLSQSPILQNKIFLWPAGVDDPGEPTPLVERETILIYQKNAPNDLLNSLVESLKLKVNKVEIITYGKYKQTDYFAKLSKTKLVIFLTQSESQGIAQQEAWMRDIPTLVWNPGKWQYNGYSWQDEKISSPYLTDTCGKFFSSIEEFEIKLEQMLNNLESFSPREYSLENFTHKKSAEKFIEIINFSEI